MWEEPSMIQIDRPWLCIGDFNCTLEDGERASKGGTSSSFIKWQDDLWLIDLGYIGPKFTWNHGMIITTRRSARLDRTICNEQWKKAFPEAKLRHLPHSYSNHCPILLQLDSKSGSYLRDHPFKFQATWMEHNDFRRLLDDNWNWDWDRSSSPSSFSETLVRWNKADVLKLPHKKKPSRHGSLAAMKT